MGCSGGDDAKGLSTEAFAEVLGDVRIATMRSGGKGRTHPHAAHPDPKSFLQGRKPSAPGHCAYKSLLFKFTQPVHFYKTTQSLEHSEPCGHAQCSSAFSAAPVASGSFLLFPGWCGEGIGASVDSHFFPFLERMMRKQVVRHKGVGPGPPCPSEVWNHPSRGHPGSGPGQELGPMTHTAPSLQHTPAP